MKSLFNRVKKLLINYILEDAYYEQADLNLDSQLNILDVIQLVNIIILD